LRPLPRDPSWAGIRPRLRQTVARANSRDLNYFNRRIDFSKAILQNGPIRWAKVLTFFANSVNIIKERINIINPASKRFAGPAKEAHNGYGHR
jgi:hypothetical protein